MSKSETNSNDRRKKCSNAEEACCDHFCAFSFLHCFGFRNSDFGFVSASWLDSGGKRFGDGGLAPFDFQGADGGGGALEAGEVGADEGVAEDVADGREDVRGGGGDGAGKGDERATLVAGLVFEDLGGDTDDRFPEEFDGVVADDVLGEREDDEVAEQGF